MNSYSQYGEDKTFVPALAGVASKQFLDIGAYHPTVFSNTRALVEIGWSGIFIEPSPGPFLNLLMACVGCGHVAEAAFGERHKLAECVNCGGTARYGTDDRFRLILAAVAFDQNLLRIEVTDDALSTSDEKSLEKWRKVGGFYGSLYTPSITLEQIFHQLGGGFEFINFDVEGYSPDLLFRMLELGVRPKALCVEHDGRQVEIARRMQAAKYARIDCNGTNEVWIRP